MAGACGQVPGGVASVERQTFRVPARELRQGIRRCRDWFLSGTAVRRVAKWR